MLLTHPAVIDVAVIGIPDAERGERCCALFALAVGSKVPSLDEIRDHCRDAGLAGFKSPEQLMVAQSIPRSAMVKIMRAHLRAPIEQAACGLVVE
ncbi:AMP-binding enzyme [Rhodococcoides yunnanense]|uniref:AMP-binding enzyme C-terminal domain-containing protein n=1 Tax=Rhodococcoides yunnanense TaxID=278209 RepID=A0ABU4BL35_9NOCA|nr:hypothetical protein [Rhodococcus yunnanensis]MDV6264920.1 hypothetical protein [Rhodococcus yunnanensis]